MAILVGVLASPAPAQDYPSRPVELVVPFTAGGGTDLLARLVSEGLGKRLRQSFVVLNRPGANTNVGTQLVARTRPDGYTLLMTSIGLAANPFLYRNRSFDPLVDLAPISLVANAPTILVVNPTLPARSLGELIDLLRQRPGALNYASYGAGSGPHLAAELFQAATGTRMVHVPYSGGAPAALGVVTNDVQMLFSSVLPVLGLIRAGSLKPIAIASDHRLALLADVPTFSESGVDYRTGTWFGLLAPARTPEPVIAALNAAAVDALRDADAGARISEQGAEVAAGSPREFAAFIRDEMERLSVVIRNANIRLD
jgi:tripartite-type tricarboxylate transporter receptor subunit TctC